MIYLDNGATTFRKPPQVERAIVYAMHHYASPGRGGYTAAMGAGNAVFSAREQASQLFDCQLDQVVFTSSATHGLNIAIHSLVKPGERVVVSGFEHNAVMRPLHSLEADVQVAGRTLFDQEDTLHGFQEAITKETKAVICTHVSNVFGYILPIEAIAQLCQERGVPLVVDASQSAGVLPVSLAKTKAAFVAMPGHKGLYGPQGTGILLCNHPFRPFLAGGTGSTSKEYAMPDFLPDGLEPGTHNVLGICGLGAGMAFVATNGVEKIHQKEQKLFQKLVEKLSAIPNLELYTGEHQSPVLSCNIHEMDCEMVAERLGAADIAVRSGMHCAPLAHESGGTLDRGTVRISLGVFNTFGEMEEIYQVLEKIGEGT